MKIFFQSNYTDYGHFDKKNTLKFSPQKPGLS